MSDVDFITPQLRGRLSAAEVRLEGEQGARLDTASRLMSAEMQLRASQEKVAELSQATSGEAPFWEE